MNKFTYMEEETKNRIAEIPIHVKYATNISPKYQRTENKSILKTGFPRY